MLSRNIYQGRSLICICRSRINNVENRICSSFAWQVYFRPQHLLCIMYSPLIIFTLWIGLPISIYGTVYNQKFAKIVNGERAPAIYPYQISLQKVTKTADDWKHVCGGAIVTEQHVVTAAHCVAKKKASRLSIWAASTSLDGDGERYLVKHYRKHPEFYESRTWLTSDIGIITIHGSFKFSENVSDQSILYFRNNETYFSS